MKTHKLGMCEREETSVAETVSSSLKSAVFLFDIHRIIARHMTAQLVYIYCYLAVIYGRLTKSLLTEYEWK